MKVISFSQQGPRAICILSANGVISSVTLRQPDSSGGTLTYEGRFEILSLAGSFTPSESGGIRNRSGGMSVSLASPDGRVVGGGVAGQLVAAGPVQIVVGSFLTGNQHEQTPKKPIMESVSPAPPPAPAVVPTSTAETEDSCPASVKPNVSSPSFRGDSWSAYNASTESRNNANATDINPIQLLVLPALHNSGLMSDEYGGPLTFTPVNPKKGVIRLSTDVNIKFSGSTICHESNVWKFKYDKNIKQYAVMMGGVLGNPGSKTLDNWFKIQKTKDGYKFVFCPSVCSTCKVKCKDLGIVLGVNGMQRLAVSKDPLSSSTNNPMSF
nr:AT-hook motif nuclear-localized protein 1-like [Tanacetum cinerariifolium]